MNNNPGRNIRQYFWATALLAITATVAPYLYKFNALELSTDTSDWGGFGSYISGVIGTIAIVITLYYLIAAKEQQDEMIKKQSVMLENQEKEISTNESFKATEFALQNHPLILKSLTKNHLEIPLKYIFITSQKGDLQATIAAKKLAGQLHSMKYLNMIILQPKNTWDK